MFKSFLDARQIPSDTVKTADLCIIGSGAAGISIAHAFAGTDIQVCLLEAGGLSIDPGVNALSQVDDVGGTNGVGRPYKITDLSADYRLRLFGGTTNHWGGQCVPLWPDDFEKQDWIEHSGWPYGYEEIEPYYRRAHELMSLGEFDYNTEHVRTKVGRKIFPFDPKRVATVVARYRRVRFGLEFGNSIDAAPNISTILYADVSSINLGDAADDTVRNVEVRSVAGNSFRVEAKIFVVAAGGIENPRLLLLSNAQRPAGLGNHSDCVGRFFMEHLSLQSGYIAAPGGDVSLDFYCAEHRVGKVGYRAHLALPANVVRELRIPKYRTEIHLGNEDHLRALKIRDGGATAGDVMALAFNPIEVGHLAWCRDDVAPSVYTLYNYVQQVPNPQSRVTLSDERDPAGRRQPRLRWKLSRLDHEGVVKAHGYIAREVARSGFGRMRIEIEDEPKVPLDGCIGGAHHMGTTRMSRDPAFGVTDGSAKVHYTNNLYVAGSSLFPTCGWPNPTLTIVATALRLADHLKAEFEKGTG